MNGRTHVTIGAAIGLTLAYNAQLDLTGTLALTGVACLGAVLPDIDHPRAGLRDSLGFVGHVLFGWLKHRGPTHSLLALALVAWVMFQRWPPIAPALAYSYLSHLLADAVTKSGIAFFWPVYREPVGLIPKALRITTGSWSESVVQVIAAGVVMWQLAQVTNLAYWIERIL